ncbi:MAG: ExeM/NucH family extracellular endonuclease, partial [Woeseiaceae bacterium]|nr:ExeM/NucH family extracellular endonuclease [Woeseiaceae bacterium]
MRTIALIAALATLLLAACGGGSPASNGATPPAPGTTAISAIQGAGIASPLAGQTVTIEAIVTGDFQDNDADAANDLGGFFVQAEMPDGDASTSDGLFVFDGSTPAVDVNVGDRVRVTGRVQEHFGETQLEAASVTVSGAGTIPPTDIMLPAAGLVSNSDGEKIANFEMYEGMLVRFPQELTITDLYRLERYGELRLSQGGRLFQFTNMNAPDPAGYAAHRDAIAARTVYLDDGRRAANPAPIRYLQQRAGNTTTDLTGVLRYSRGSGGNGTETWRLMPTSEPVFVNANPRPAAPAIAGSLRIASFNALNFFSTIDTGASVCGPAAASGCRGADSSDEYQRQLAKTTAALAMIDADIVGLVELENNASASLQAIVDALNAIAGAGSYEYIATGTIGSDAIKVGLIYRPARVSPQGPFALLTQSVDARFNDDKNRPVLAQSFTAAGSGGTLTVAVAHLKSKGSNCDDVGDPNISDGQGNCSRTRTDAAAATADWLASDPTGSGDPDFLLLGDLNAYVKEQPLAELTRDGRVNLVAAANGGMAYSFLFDGQAGALDHAIASASLVPQVAAAIEWHINADEAPVHDYNLENSRDPAIFD